MEEKKTKETDTKNITLEMLRDFKGTCVYMETLICLMEYSEPSLQHASFFTVSLVHGFAPFIVSCILIG